MDILSNNSTCLELSIAMPGFSSSSSLQSSGQSDVSAMKDLELDINQIPSGVEEECVEKEFGGPPRKKLRLTKEQSHVLEQSFKQYHILNPKQKEGLADQLKLKPRQVEVWFQNRRARYFTMTYYWWQVLFILKNHDVNFDS
ncbi:homeobox-leucine zipper protein ATHB-17-like [Olea europaea var. sylvestris]|uniref:homeobox-leucine zipper protein ATHB-17-like n=1 Tax=Olea europaea var. sylvestris TaxID=158386 RepID=UPI000C1D184F|nr:homeobox-leucine zipper protein ATHB-17-like [Olea europaea var. sylvestris]